MCRPSLSAAGLLTGLPVRLVPAIAAAIFATLGLATLLGAGERLGF
jgi:hypothetical protein